MNMYHEQWNDDNGDGTYRLNYDLNENSLVFDVGGYMGDWARNIYSKYQCEIWIFEPVKEYYDFICIRFKRNKKIKVFNIGLSDKTKFTLINKDSDSSSIFRRKYGSIIELEGIKLIDFKEFLKDHEIDYIDLMKINIEGGEYPLLSDIVDNNLQTKIGNIQVQFHDFIKDEGRGRPYIHEKLWITHHLTYNFPFLWENWEINK